jgi:predicted nucleic acid-binding protein
MTSVTDTSILVDLNVILDVLAQRQPHYLSSALVWGAVETGVVKGYVAAHTVTTLFYLMARHLDRDQAITAIQKLLTIFEVAAVDRLVIERALALGWPDFEDAVQMAAAVQTGTTYLITRNPQDFKDELVSVLGPNDLLNLLSTSAL